MGLSFGYIYMDFIDILYLMYIGNLNYGIMLMGFMYFYMVLVLVDIVCYGFELFVVIKMNKIFLIMVRVYFFCLQKLKIK